MSLTVASLAIIVASSCGDMSKESPVDNLPTWNKKMSMMNFVDSHQQDKTV